MQAITTTYTFTNGGQGRILVESWHGKKRYNADDALNSEQNHRRAVQLYIDEMNERRRANRPGENVPPFEIVTSAPLAGEGWAFMVDYAPEIAPCHMSITVRFMPGTNTRPAYMKVHSWLFPKGTTVNYSRATQPGDVQGAAFYAARIMLDMINDEVKDAGISYSIRDYIQTYNGDRVFSLI